MDLLNWRENQVNFLKFVLVIKINNLKYFYLEKVTPDS